MLVLAIVLSFSEVLSKIIYLRRHDALAHADSFAAGIPSFSYRTSSCCFSRDVGVTLHDDKEKSQILEGFFSVIKNSRAAGR